MSTEITEEDVLREILDARAAEIHTALPARVIRYDAARQTVDVQPMIRDVHHTVDGALRTRSMPTLPAVPVVFIRGGAYFVTVPLAEGDTGMLVFSELPIDRWRSTGQEAHPVNARRHGLGNAVFFPGVRPRAQALAAPGIADHLVLGAEGGCQVHVEPDAVRLGSAAASDPVPLESKLQAELVRIKADITALRIAVSTALGVAIATATTAGATPQTGAAVAALLSSVKTVVDVYTATDPSSTASTKVKAI